MDSGLGYWRKPKKVLQHFFLFKSRFDLEFVIGIADEGGYILHLLWPEEIVYLVFFYAVGDCLQSQTEFTLTLA